MQRISPIIQAEELISLAESKRLIIINAGNGTDAKKQYDQKHLDEAIFVDLNTQLSDIKADFAEGGRHPLPTVEDFCDLLGNIGVSNDSHVIVYDDKNGANAAARLWWMLRSVGHNNVQVLNGGIQEAERAGYPINGDKVTPLAKSMYNGSEWILPLSFLEEVAKHSLDENFIVIDVRESGRYKGEFEPIDLVAGHIPGAINIPFSTNLDEKGLFLSPEILNSNYTSILGDTPQTNVIIHCGSGVTACHTILALDYAEIHIPKLYVGSWSEWSRNDKEIVTEL